MSEVLLPRAFIKVKSTPLVKLPLYLRNLNRKILSLLIIILSIYGLYSLIKNFTTTPQTNYQSLADFFFLDKPTLPSYKDSLPRNKQALKRLNINLNTADTTQLKQIYGIGKVLSQRIVTYRQKLGGFHNIAQLTEVRGIDKSLIPFLEKNLLIDTACLKKIFINFATHSQLTTHPYVSESMARRIIKQRKLKGGYNNLKELIDNNILLPKEGQKIAPYITFRVQENEDLHLKN